MVIAFILDDVCNGGVADSSNITAPEVLGSKCRRWHQRRKEFRNVA